MTVNKGKKAEHQPSYPVLRPSDMLPRDQIRLVPEAQLDPLMRAELRNLRRGIPYNFTVADTPENRENFNLKAIYFQMSTYKEGWEFKPERLQVVYLPPGDTRFNRGQARIFEFAKGGAGKEMPFSLTEYLPYGISSGDRLGFTINDNTGSATQMRPEEADDLGGKVIKLFR